MSRSTRTSAAVATTRAVNALSRHLGRGHGTVAGGRAGLLVDPGLLAHLAEGRRVVLVSGTNGKTTTTALLAAALHTGGWGGGRVVTNDTGSNMPAGHVAAMAQGPPGAPAVLEVDEGYLPAVLRATRPEAVLLLNLSRDQLDRMNEVRMLAGRWRSALGTADGVTVVANADDPLVVWGAGTAREVVWVSAGLGWRADAVGCPSCEGSIAFARDGSGQWASACGFARPTPAVRAPDGGSVPVTAAFADGRVLEVALAIPGRFNAANATMAAAAAEAVGVGAEAALAAMAPLRQVAGRFAVHDVDGVATRVMLAKNPAGWSEHLDLLEGDAGPVVVGINARVANGRDPSWLWDVPFERLRGRPVVATGERCLDLAVRLRYAEVPHETVPDAAAAVRRAGLKAAGDTTGRARVDFIGNYTAFADLVDRR